MSPTFEDTFENNPYIHIVGDITDIRIPSVEPQSPKNRKNLIKWIIGKDISY